MSKFKGAAIVEPRIYEDPLNPATSDYYVALHTTVTNAVFDGKTGKKLSDTLAGLSEKISQLEENAGTSGGGPAAEPENSPNSACLGIAYLGAAFLGQ